MSTTLMQYPQWQKPLLQAVMEMKSDRLAENIKIAETAIFERLGESTRPPDNDEVIALLCAISTLQSLKKSGPSKTVDSSLNQGSSSATNQKVSINTELRKEHNGHLQDPSRR